jgi:ribonucleoside-diphosphate reductase alpha chain
VARWPTRRGDGLKALHDAEAENLRQRAAAAPPKTAWDHDPEGDPLGTMFVNITEDDRGQPFEVFITL